MEDRGSYAGTVRQVASGQAYDSAEAGGEHKKSLRTDLTAIAALLRDAIQ